MQSVSTETALSRAAAGSTGLRPCEAAEANPCMKISRSKRRKLRERCVAVRHALINTAALKDHTCFVLQAKKQNESGTNENHNIGNMTALGLRLSSLEQMVSELHWCLVGQFSGATCDAGGKDLQGTFLIGTGGTLSKDAMEFCPVKRREAATKIQTCWRMFQDHKVSLREHSTAAAVIQRSYRKWRAHSSENATASPEGHRLGDKVSQKFIPAKTLQIGDRVVVCEEGILHGATGTLLKAGGKLFVNENGEQLEFEALASVRLDDDPHGFTSRPISIWSIKEIPADTVADQEARTRLMNVVHKSLAILETGRVPQHCSDLWLPLLKKAQSTLEAQGTEQQCKLMEEILSARLDQIAGDIFKAAAIGAQSPSSQNPVEGETDYE